MIKLEQQDDEELAQAVQARSLNKYLLGNQWRSLMVGCTVAFWISMVSYGFAKICGATPHLFDKMVWTEAHDVLCQLLVCLSVTTRDARGRQSGHMVAPSGLDGRRHQVWH